MSHCPLIIDLMQEYQSPYRSLYNGISYVAVGIILPSKPLLAQIDLGQTCSLRLSIPSSGLPTLHLALDRSFDHRPVITLASAFRYLQTVQLTRLTFGSWHPSLRDSSQPLRCLFARRAFVYAPFSGSCSV